MTENVVRNGTKWGWPSYTGGVELPSDYKGRGKVAPVLIEHHAGKAYWGGKV
jgi:glucose/arabinose dehydrogenase